jgi:CheY-like chemotaxis protein
MNIMNNRSEIFLPILVVEDEEDHARLIIKSLTENGSLVNQIIHVENGQEAIDFLNRTGKYSGEKSPLPGLILLDVKMPMKNGFEVLKEIKSNETLASIPVVMLTTSSTAEDIEMAMKLGANDYIVKPVRFDDFTHKVSKVGYYWGFISDAQRLVASEKYENK